MSTDQIIEHIKRIMMKEIGGVASTMVDSILRSKDSLTMDYHKRNKSLVVMLALAYDVLPLVLDDILPSPISERNAHESNIFPLPLTAVNDWSDVKSEEAEENGTWRKER